jgi:ACS family hexuronate transporter-like MFS transporter
LKIENTLKKPLVKKYRWVILTLLFFATTINYLDRQVISLLKDDYLEPLFGWSESDYANIVIAFSIAYAIGMLISGFFIDRLGTKRGYALFLTLWSFATIGHAFAKSIFSFVIARVSLGVTQAGNFPASVKTVAEWFPKKERALAAGIFNSGTNVGAIIAPIIVPFIALTMGWQSTFIITGSVGLIWLIFWFLLYDNPHKHKKISKEEYDYIHSDLSEINENAEGTAKVKWVKLLGYRQTWAFAILKFFSDPIWWFLLFWLPTFLNKQYGMSKMDLALPIAVVYLMAMFGSIAGGWLSGYFINRGWSVHRARRSALFLFALAAVPMLLAQTLGAINYWYAVLIIGLATSTHQAWSATIFTTVSDMFPKKAVASVVGIGGMFGAIGVIIIAKSAGLILDHFKALGNLEHGYSIMFVICAFSYLLAWTFFSLLVPKMPKAKFLNIETN